MMTDEKAQPGRRSDMEKVRKEKRRNEADQCRRKSHERMHWYTDERIQRQIVSLKFQALIGPSVDSLCQQPTPPRGFLFWHFRHCLVRYYLCGDTGKTTTFTLTLSFCQSPALGPCNCVAICWILISSASSLVITWVEPPRTNSYIPSSSLHCSCQLIAMKNYAL